MTVGKRARTLEEMRFAASLQPCPKCGSKVLGPLELSGDGTHWTYRGPCPKCGTMRTFEFSSIGNPVTTRTGRFDLGPGESELITPDQFLAVLDEANAALPSDPKAIAPEQRAEMVRLATRALTAVTELLRIVPAGTAQLPGARDPRLNRPAMEREFLRLKKLVRALAPAASLDDAALDAHLEFLRRGARGDGQITLEGKRLADERYAGADLTLSSFVRCDMTNIDLSYAHLDESELRDDVLVAAMLEGTSLTQAHITDGTWTRARLSTAKLNGAKVVGTDLSKTDLDRSAWYDAEVTRVSFVGARFGNAVLDRAVFLDCSFRDASLAPWLPEPAATSSGARFEKCDLRGTDWTGRDLSGTTFVGCQLAGAHGAPAAMQGLVVERCDVDLAAFTQQLGGKRAGGGRASLADVVGELFALVTATHVPRLAELRAALEKPGRQASLAGPNLSCPDWAYGASSANDVFIAFGPDADVAGIRLTDDGHATTAQVSVRRGTLADAEKAFGAGRSLPKRYPKLSTSFAQPTVAGHRIPAYVSYDKTKLELVELVFENNRKA